MKNPFPGMNPFLEGSHWGDVHHTLITKIRQKLVLLVSPKYVTSVERYVVEDNNPQSEMGIMYPDVEVFLRKTDRVEEPAVAYGNQKIKTPPNLTIPIIPSIPVRIPFVKIIDRENNDLVTAIEILSPVNKRKPGLIPYLKKRLEMQRAGVHFLEIDLLRRGKRTVDHPEVEKTDYLVALSKAKTPRREVWLIDLKQSLPVIPVPLLAGDEEVLLDLQECLDEVFVETGYGLSLNYEENPPPPKFNQEKTAWLKEQIEG